MNPLRNIPSLSDLLDNPTLKNLSDKISQSAVTSTVRTVLDEVAQELKTTATDWTVPNMSQLVDRITARIHAGEQLPLRPVINATGMIFGSAAGPPPLSNLARAAIHRSVSDYCYCPGAISGKEREATETDPTSASLESAIGKHLHELTGTEASLVVNSRRSATTLALAALASNKETVISIGHLADLGAGYRVSEIAEAAGTRLREVGSVNRTSLSDYENAICESTAALLVVHAGSYQQTGQAGAVSLAELGGMLHRRRPPAIPLVYDLGPACLVDIGSPALKFQKVDTALLHQADVVVVSCELLTGQSDQAILLGRKSVIDRIGKHPFYGMVRTDRFGQTALESSLQVQCDPERAVLETPALQLMSASIENLRNRAQRLAPQLASQSPIAEATLVETMIPMGRDLCCSDRLPGVSVAMSLNEGHTSGHLLQTLASGCPAVLAQIDEEDRLVIHLRSVLPHQDRLIVEAFSRLDQPTD